MLNTYKTILTEKKQLTFNVFLFHFQLLDPKTIDFIAGQYLILKVNNQCRLYSICSPDSIKDSFDLVIEIVKDGLGSTYFNNLSVNDSVDFQGPAGVFRIKSDDRDKIFLATGTGIAPIRSMIYSNVKCQMSNAEYYLFWGLRTRQDVYFLDEFKKLTEQNPNFNFKICLSREKDLTGLDGHYFMFGHINDGLLNFYNSQALHVTRCTLQEFRSQFNYYVCGGRDMVVSMVDSLQKQGITKENIFFEKF